MAMKTPTPAADAATATPTETLDPTTVNPGGPDMEPGGAGDEPGMNGTGEPTRDVPVTLETLQKELKHIHQHIVLGEFKDELNSQVLGAALESMANQLETLGRDRPTLERHREVMRRMDDMMREIHQLRELEELRHDNMELRLSGIAERTMSGMSTNGRNGFLEVAGAIFLFVAGMFVLWFLLNAAEMYAF